MARHDTPTNSWPALFEFVVSFVKDGDPAKREVRQTGIYSFIYRYAQSPELEDYFEKKKEKKIS